LTGTNKQAVRRKLARLDAGAHMKVVLNLRKAAVDDPATPAPRPEQFGSRVEYRKAAVAHQKAHSEAGIRNSLSRLQALGLETRPSPLSGTVVAEGTAEQLIRALDDDCVEAAAFDEEITLIRPVRSGSSRTPPED